MGDSDAIRREDEGSLTTKASIHQSGFPRLRRPNNELLSSLPFEAESTFSSYLEMQTAQT
jgi:hypothetical protein